MSESVDELRARFAALRQHDGYTAPDFREMLGKADLARAESAFALPRVRWIAVAAGLVLAAALLVGKSAQRSDAPPAARVVPSITNWQSPTAGLLTPPVRELVAPRPLLSSVFDSVTTQILTTHTESEGD